MEIHRHVLKTKERFAVQTLVKDEYTSSGKTDPEFAAYATEKLGFAVKESHIKAARYDFDIPSARTRAMEANNGEAALRHRIERLEGFIMKNFPKDWAHFLRETEAP